jgi:hypothetical protein
MICEKIRALLCICEKIREYHEITYSAPFGMKCEIMMRMLAADVQDLKD